MVWVYPETRSSIRGTAAPGLPLRDLVHYLVKPINPSQHTHTQNKPPRGSPRDFPRCRRPFSCPGSNFLEIGLPENCALGNQIASASLNCSSVPSIRPWIRPEVVLRNALRSNHKSAASRDHKHRAFAEIEDCTEGRTPKSVHP